MKSQWHVQPVRSSNKTLLDGIWVKKKPWTRQKGWMADSMSQQGNLIMKARWVYAAGDLMVKKRNNQLKANTAGEPDNTGDRVREKQGIAPSPKTVAQHERHTPQWPADTPPTQRAAYWSTWLILELWPRYVKPHQEDAGSLQVAGNWSDLINHAGSLNTKSYKDTAGGKENSQKQRQKPWIELWGSYHQLS